MIRLVAFIRPHKLEEVKTALSAKGVTGITVSEARGCGSSPESVDWFLGQEYVVSLPARIKIETVVEDEQAEMIAQTIVSAARTGQPGDGKVFFLKEWEVIRVRTGERGVVAL